eukprot:TRINITY_DN4496_c5_g1_i1.p1 TRINITY_DN4496_c5_g1~~TRINITY_DN4496_c5_g1_i1.p1  ORF type:complete len:154 (+),score=14.97 TRINITY_DN4496_c5_g1_i1:70-531(+)
MSPVIQWKGAPYYGFWGLLINALGVVTTFVVIFVVSLFKIVVPSSLALLFLATLVVVVVLNMRVRRMPAHPIEYVGLLWPLSLGWQFLFGLSWGVVTCFLQQYFRLHVHHEWSVDPTRYVLWIMSIFLTTGAEPFVLGVICNNSPVTLKEHSE